MAIDSSGRINTTSTGIDSRQQQDNTTQDTSTLGNKKALQSGSAWFQSSSSCNNFTEKLVNQLFQIVRTTEMVTTALTGTGSSMATSSLQSSSSNDALFGSRVSDLMQDVNFQSTSGDNDGLFVGTSRPGSITNMNRDRKSVV